MTNPIEHSEGPVTRAIEEQTAKLPSDAFLWAAGASIATSLVLKMLDRHHEAALCRAMGSHDSDSRSVQ